MEIKATFQSFASKVKGAAEATRNFVAETKEKHLGKIARAVSAVALAALAVSGLPASVWTAPYVGVALARASQLSLATRIVILGALSTNVLAATTGLYLVATAVTVAVKARSLLTVLGAIDIVAKLVIGTLAIRSWQAVNLGFFDVKSAAGSAAPSVAAASN